MKETEFMMKYGTGGFIDEEKVTVTRAAAYLINIGVLFECGCAIRLYYVSWFGGLGLRGLNCS